MDRIPDTRTRNTLELDWVMLAALVCLSIVAIVSILGGNPEIARDISIGIVGSLFRVYR